MRADKPLKAKTTVSFSLLCFSVMTSLARASSRSTIQEESKDLNILKLSL